MVKKSVTIIYHWYPHYRQKIFLAMKNEFDLTLIGGVNSNYRNLKLMDLNTFNFKEVGNNWIGPFLFQKGLIQTLRFSKSDNFVFLADWKFISTWIFILFFKRKNVKYIGWTHGISQKNNSLLKIIKLIFYSRFDEIITYNEEAADYLVSRNINAVPIYNSLQEDFQVVQKNGKEKDWIFIGRILETRRIIDFIKVMGENLNEINDTKFHIVGPTDNKEFLEKTILSNGLQNNVVYHGPIYNFNNLIELSKECKYFIHPSDVGLAALLALNLNLILFTHDNFSTHKPEVEVSKQSGMLLTFDNHNGINIEKLIENKFDLIPSDRWLHILKKWSVKNQIQNFKNILNG